MSAKDEQVRQDSYKAFESYDFDNDEQFQVKEFPPFHIFLRILKGFKH